jgi:hypothetical protein
MSAARPIVIRVEEGLSVGVNIAAAPIHKPLEAGNEKRLLRVQQQLAG